MRGIDGGSNSNHADNVLATLSGEKGKPCPETRADKDIGVIAYVVQHGIDVG